MQFHTPTKLFSIAAVLLCSLSGMSVFADTVKLVSSSQQLESKQESPRILLGKTLEAIKNNPERPLSGLSVLVIKRGKVVYDETFGLRQINEETPSKSLPVERDTKFRIASISKIETAIGIMRLVEQNKINLDEDAGRYLGFNFRNPNFPDTPVTVRMLLSHTSSIRDAEKYTLPPTETLEQALVAGGKHWDNGVHWAGSAEGNKDLIPGKYFEYANLNYGLLGTIIEAVSGERFDKYMRAHVLQPLGCKASYNVQDFSKSELKKLSVLYRKMDANEKWDPHGAWHAQVDDYHRAAFTLPAGADSYVPGKNASWLSPQGGLRISAIDLSKIMRMLLNGGEFNGARILKSETVDLMFSPQWTYDKTKRNGDTYQDLMVCYGLGPQILTGSSGDRLLEDRKLSMVGHIGDANGLLGCFMMDRERKDGFVAIISGVGADPEKNRGSYSSFFKWQEEIITAIYSTVLKDAGTNQSHIGQTTRTTRSSKM